MSDHVVDAAEVPVEPDWPDWLAAVVPPSAEAPQVPPLNLTADQLRFIDLKNLARLQRFSGEETQ